MFEAECHKTIPPSVGMTLACHSERSFSRSEESMDWKQDFNQARDSSFRRNDIGLSFRTKLFA
ncbi:MAG TPA: hypothetical protein VFM70_07910 [Salinimicrobium sp.]|nr:hypothetical protein [Salinimicrobium sp.]